MSLPLVAIALLAAAPSASAGEGGGLYVALGDSVAAGPDTYVGLLYFSFPSTLGVASLSNRAEGGENSYSIRTPGGQLDDALSDINAPSDTRAVTIDIGGNDRNACANSWDTCPYRANLAATLSDLKAALDADPGSETFIAMVYYNPASGLGGSEEAWYEAQLFGSDLKVDCGITSGPQVGISDVVFQEAARHGAVVANAYPAFKAGGQSLMADDGLHPNDAGQAAIADAFLHPNAGCASPPLDLTPPDTTIVSGPIEGSLIDDASPTFAFTSSESPATFECALDGGAYSACTSPHTLASLAGGHHRFAVRALDAANNFDPTPASRSFRVVDTVAPQTKIVKAPKRRSDHRRVRFRFRSTERGSTFSCKLDRRAWRSCESPKRYRVSSGRHAFKVRATDRAGNSDSSPAKWRWRVKRR